MAKKVNYASLFTLRADGRYMGHYRDQDGTRHSVYDRDPERLYQKIQALEAPPPLTFREIAEAWRDYLWPKIRAGTQGCYTAAYNRAIERFGDREAVSIEAFEISNHLAWMAEQDYSTKTIQTQRVIYRSVYRHAIIDPVLGREIRTNPAADVPLPSGMKKAVKREAPEDDAVAKIRAAAGEYWGLFPLFLMSTGFRRGEALAVQWRDVDFKKKQITCSKQISYAGGIAKVADTKTDAGVRVVPLLPDLRAALKAAKPKDAKLDNYVFHGEDPAKFLTESTYRRRWMHYCKEHGFVTDEPEQRTSTQGKKYTVHHYKPTLTAHVLRHGYATMLFEAGVDEYTAQQLLGHANVETTIAIYTHLRQKKKSESIKKLEKHVASQIGKQKKTGT